MVGELNVLIENHQSALAIRELRKVDASLAIRADVEPTSPEEEPPVDSSPMPPLVSEADVNLDGVYEIDLNDPPRIRILDETIEQLIQQYGSSTLIPDKEKARQAMFDAPPEEILEIMFKVRARDLYDQVEVLNGPATMATFRKRIHDNWLLNRCGLQAPRRHPGSSRTIPTASGRPSQRSIPAICSP